VNAATAGVARGSPTGFRPVKLLVKGSPLRSPEHHHLRLPDGRSTALRKCPDL